MVCSDGFELGEGRPQGSCRVTAGGFMVFLGFSVQKNRFSSFGATKPRGRPLGAVCQDQGESLVKAMAALQGRCRIAQLFLVLLGDTEVMEHFFF